MSRTYADPIDVRRASRPSVEQPLGPPSDPTHPSGSSVDEPPGARPEQFLWRGRLYVVREVIAHWIESSAWWGGSKRALEGAIPPHEHEVWRVEAQAGRCDSAGVYDLCRDISADRWVLARTFD